MSAPSNDDSDASNLLHPVLDNPNRIQRIIANPVYDKLTKSRAAQIRHHHSTLRLKPILPSADNKSNKLKSKSIKLTDPNKKAPLPSIRTNENQHHYPPPFRLPSPTKHNRHIPSNHPSRAQSVTSSNPSDPKSITEGALRYVETKNGFELQRYSSKNWLTVDMISKDACQHDERVFREMVARKNRTKTLADSVFTPEYYRQRWEQLMSSYRQGHLTHEEWAKQNYQLHCLKQFYLSASEREILHQEETDELERRIRADNAFLRWKEMKNEENYERQGSHVNTSLTRHLLGTPFSPVTIDSSYVGNPSLTNNHRSSISSQSPDLIMENGLNEGVKIHRKKSTIEPLKAHLYDQPDRWSISSMIKRVVGLAEPLPSRNKPLSNFKRDYPLPTIRI